MGTMNELALEQFMDSPSTDLTLDMADSDAWEWFAAFVELEYRTRGDDLELGRQVRRLVEQRYRKAFANAVQRAKEERGIAAYEAQL